MIEASPNPDKATDEELARFFDFDTVDEMIASAKLINGDGLTATLIIQTCAGAWVCSNSPKSTWRFHENEDWTDD